MFSTRRDAIKLHLRKLIWLSGLDQRAQAQGETRARSRTRPREGERIPVPGKGWQRVAAGTLRWGLGAAALARHVAPLVTVTSL